MSIFLIYLHIFFELSLVPLTNNALNLISALTGKTWKETQTPMQLNQLSGEAQTEETRPPRDHQSLAPCRHKPARLLYLPITHTCSVLHLIFSEPLLVDLHPVARELYQELHHTLHTQQQHRYSRTYAALLRGAAEKRHHAAHNHSLVHTPGARRRYGDNSPQSRMPTTVHREQEHCKDSALP